MTDEEVVNRLRMLAELIHGRASSSDQQTIGLTLLRTYALELALSMDRAADLISHNMEDQP